MSYIYDDVDKLEGTEKVGTKHCVVLVQRYANAPVTSKWTEGKTVLGDQTIRKGTAIATFVNGKYPNAGTGNHAALYVSQDAAGIWIMDQWRSDAAKPKVCQRHIDKKGKNADGTYKNPSNNAEAYSVIE